MIVNAIKNGWKPAHLILRNCGLGLLAAKYIADILPNSSIRVLDLSNNHIAGYSDIQDEGVFKILEVLPKSPQLSGLYLERNKISSNGMESIYYTLSATRITHGNFEGNSSALSDDNIKRQIAKNKAREQYYFILSLGLYWPKAIVVKEVVCINSVRISLFILHAGYRGICLPDFPKIKYLPV